MDYGQLATQLEATGDDGVLRRFAPAELYAALDGVDPQPLRVAMVVGTETTGLDPETDRIIDLGYVFAEFHPKTGRVHRVLERYSGLKDPGAPIPAAITALTGIADADVAGKRFDEARVDAAIARAHRAPVDAEVLLFLPTRSGPEERPILSHRLERSGRTAYCVSAEGAPFEMKRLKRDKGYTWRDGTRPGQPIKAWYRADVMDLAAELAMPGHQIHPRPARVTVNAITGRERDTDRCRSREQLPLGTVS